MGFRDWFYLQCICHTAHILQLLVSNKLKWCDILWIGHLYEYSNASLCCSWGLIDEMIGSNSPPYVPYLFIWIIFLAKNTLKPGTTNLLFHQMTSSSVQLLVAWTNQCVTMLVVYFANDTDKDNIDNNQDILKIIEADDDINQQLPVHIIMLDHIL